MATPYTGNPTAAEAPSAAPQPGVDPIAAIPQDGVDGGSWASLVQALKMPTDQLAFCRQADAGAYSLIALVVDGKGAVVQAARSVDSPLFIWCESVGQNPRSLYDKNGFVMGRNNGFNEQWLTAVALGASSAASFQSQASWSMATSANAAIGQLVATSAYPTLGFTITPGTANGNGASMQSTQSIWYPSTIMSAVMEWEFTPNTSLANIKWLAGFSDNSDPTGSANAVAFYSTAGGNWQLATGAGGALTLAAAGSPVAPVVGTQQRFRVEYHGSATPIGVSTAHGLAANTAKAYFYLNEVFYGATSTTLPAAIFNATFTGKCSGVATGTGAFGPVRTAWNRFASVPLL